MPTIAEVISFLERIAPPQLQESYDNSGLICGDRTAEVKGIIVSLDAIESVVDEAIETGVNLIVSHHPIVFSGLISLTGANYVERTVIKAIKHDIALYGIHTNLDNVLNNGVNQKLAEQLELTNVSILRPSRDVVNFGIRVSNLLKEDVVNALNSELSAEIISFNTQIEVEKEVIVSGPRFIEKTIAAVCRQYQTTYWHQELKSSAGTGTGAGMIGHNALPMTENEFLAHVKQKLHLQVIRHTALRGRSIQKVAICGGSGSFLLPAALKAGADIFVTSDYKYHQFFDAEGQLVIADVGHFESEQFTIDALVDLINGKFSNFAARCAKTRTNPVYYFV